MILLLPELIETERCWLRPFELADLDDLHVLYSDPKVMTTRKIGVQDKAGTAEQLKAFVDLWQKRGFGLYAVFERGSNIFVGECGFRLYAPDQPDLVEISYGLRPKFWGGGIATEIATAMIDAGFKRLLDDTLIAHAQSQNAASLRVLNKLGFERLDVGALRLPPGLTRCALNRDRWQHIKGSKK
ncbi:GNAT family N-acetyltransferase [Yoonia sp. 2307UL14-13]|uniref:GNAT family N-acetyltransferase n=1 Tax=Yoonia sp. 2307UL14-13 TaxID=3126506 RepID=UPI0030A7F12B